MTSPTNVASAEELERAEQPVVYVPIAGTDKVIECIVPDLLAGLAHKRLSLPLLEQVFMRLSAWDGHPEQVLADLDEGIDDIAKVIDQWVCLVARRPRVVEAEDAAGVDAVWIQKLRLDTKLAILRATSATLARGKVSTPEVDFRRRGRAHSDARPDRATVSAAPVADAGDSGSDSRA